MGVSNCGSTQEEWKIESMHQSQKGEHGNKQGTIGDNYPLPITKHLLERVAKKEAYSFLDGFSGYNHVSIHPNDQHKIAFATEFGIYAY